MRWIDWVFVIGVIALIVGPLMTLRIIAKADKRRSPPPSDLPRRSYDDEEDD